MKKQDSHVQAFLALIRAGLWEQGVRLLPYGPIDFDYVYQLAEEQSVVGLVAAGLEHVVDSQLQKKYVAHFSEQTLQQEERNKAMNYFIGVIVEKMRETGIHVVLIKGQGVAQCYSRPLWRSSGDVDFFSDSDNYRKALDFLTPLAVHVDSEDKVRLHAGMTLDPWVVELHGTMHTGISKKIDAGIDEVQRDIFENNGTRTWQNDNTCIFLPNPDNDVLVIFTHFIDHFYVGGVGLRQISDWCRLLWTYRDVINMGLLEKRLRSMGLLTEWKAFASFAVEYLGMPVEGMPLYEPFKKYRRKAYRILCLVLYTGNFGHNKDESYRTRYPTLFQKMITFFRRMAEFSRLTTIFPKNAPVFFITYVTRRTQSAL